MNKEIEKDKIFGINTREFYVTSEKLQEIDEEVTFQVVNADSLEQAKQKVIVVINVFEEQAKKEEREKIIGSLEVLRKILIPSLPYTGRVIRKELEGRIKQLEKKEKK